MPNWKAGKGISSAQIAEQTVAGFLRETPSEEHDGPHFKVRDLDDNEEMMLSKEDLLNREGDITVSKPNRDTVHITLHDDLLNRELNYELLKAK